MEICHEQSNRLIEAEKVIESIRIHLKVNARELCDNQLRNFHQTIEDLGKTTKYLLIEKKKQSFRFQDIRIQQRRKELEDIRQKNSRFHSNMSHLRSDTDRLLQMIERSPDVNLRLIEIFRCFSFSFQNADALVNEIDSTLSALQYLGRDLKRSLDVSSSSDIDRELKDMASSVDSVRDSLDRAKKSYEVKRFLIQFDSTSCFSFV